MADKYSLTLEQTKKYTRRIVSLIKENEEFYIFYFLMLEQSSILVE